MWVDGVGDVGIVPYGGVGDGDVEDAVPYGQGRLRHVGYTGKNEK